jgi:hypothetical protein
VKLRALRIWIDLENTPHVLFFEPVIRELEALGHTVTITARGFAGTLPLAKAKGLSAIAIGQGYEGGRAKWGKIMHSSARAVQLLLFARGRKFDVAVNHCSRTQTLAAKWLGIPAFATIDYEYVDLDLFKSVKRFMIPDLIPIDAFADRGVPRDALRTYRGLKEDVYLEGFTPRQDVRALFGIPAEALLVTFRPISDTAHYGHDEGYVVQEQFLQRLLGQENVHVVIVPRTRLQKQLFAPRAKAHANLHVPLDVVDGPSLLFYSDLVISGGGTMIREAAALGIPALSCFEGKIGTVDASLIEQGRLTLVQTIADIDRVLPVKRRPNPPRVPDKGPLHDVVECICETAGL